MLSLNALNEKLVGLGGVASLPESGNTAAKSDTIDSVFLMTLFLTQRRLFRLSKLRHPHREPAVQKQLGSSVFLPSVFEEKESFGSDVADAIAQRERTMRVRKNHWNQSLRSYKINTRLRKIARSCVSLR